MLRPNIIVLEGCDKTGKTTLAKEICKRLKMDYVKVSNPKGDPYEEYVRLILNVKRPTLFDRLHLGEPVYGTHVRGKNQLTPEKFRNVELLLRQHNAVVIYTENTVDWISKKFDDDKETFISKSDIKSILSLYRKVLKKSSLPLIKYKIGDGYDWIKYALKPLKDNKITYKTRVIGTSNPDILIVGDVNNTNQNKSYDQLPFDFGPSSRYLFKILQKFDPDLERTAITNSLKVHMPTRNPSNIFKAELEELDPRVVVFLGNNATRLLHSVDMVERKVIILPHPQYISRFYHHSDSYENNFKKIYADRNNKRGQL